MKRYAVLVPGLLMLAGWLLPGENSPNTLTPKEKAEGWRLLFDGTSFDGWRGYRMTGIPKAVWKIEDGLLKTVSKARGRELITVQKFNDFDLSWEWRIAPAGNSGIKYLVTEERPAAPGHEYQMIDDKENEDGSAGPKSATASFYDVMPPASDEPLRPAGEWNQSRVLIEGNRVEHWLNGKKVLEYELGSERLKAEIAKSKFKRIPDFGSKIQGHIMLTYHGDECWFRNIKLRELAAK